MPRATAHGYHRWGSPKCWLTTTCSRVPRQNGTGSRPRQSIGGTSRNPGGNAVASGVCTNDAAFRRWPEYDRVVHALYNVAVCNRKPSAISCIVQRLFVGDGGRFLPLRLPDVITSGEMSSCNKRCCNGLAGSITPTSVRDRGAMPHSAKVHTAYPASTIGATGVVATNAPRSAAFAPWAASPPMVSPDVFTRPQHRHCV